MRIPVETAHSSAGRDEYMNCLEIGFTGDIPHSQLHCFSADQNGVVSLDRTKPEHPDVKELLLKKTLPWADGLSDCAPKFL